MKSEKIKRDKTTIYDKTGHLSVVGVEKMIFLAILAVCLSAASAATPASGTCLCSTASSLNVRSAGIFYKFYFCAGPLGPRSKRYQRDSDSCSVK